MPRERRGSPPARETGPQRIAKLLARAGVASRREVERMIAEGRISIEGEVVTTPATLLHNLRGVSIDGKPVRPAQATRMFRFYKPQGTITAAHDAKGRPTIYDRLPKGLPRLMPVGRLDFMTEGLILLTNDGELKRKLELPKSAVVRRYRARAFGTVSQADLDRLAEGVTIDGIRYGSIDANLERRTGRNCWIELSLTEGKNREVRRVLADLGLQVSRLIRTTYGPIGLAGLEPGQVDEVT
ncbi:MAG TPA: pseudouridine synthase, partial [Sphingomicrobium sp.]|nr:pseudouridine synthase [Sphingomicrobium sp.]